MDKKSLWDIFVNKNPNFTKSGANLTANGLKKFFDTVYSKAHEHGFNNGKAYQRKQKYKDPVSTFMDSFMK